MPTLEELRTLRESPEIADSQWWQDILGPQEHQAYLRTATQGDPMQGTRLAMMTAPYTMAKYAAQYSPNLTLKMLAQLGVAGASGGGPAKMSNPSLMEMLKAYQGYLQGLGVMQ